MIKFYLALNHTYRHPDASWTITNSIFLLENLSVGYHLSFHHPLYVSPSLSLSQSMSITSYFGNFASPDLDMSLHLSHRLQHTGITLTASYAQWPIQMSLSVTQTLVVSDNVTLSLTCYVSGPLTLPTPALKDKKSVPHISFR